MVDDPEDEWHEPVFRQLFRHTLYTLGNRYITDSAAFQMVCLAKPVLETALAAINDLQGDNLDIKNELVGNFTIYLFFFSLAVLLFS